MATYLFKTTSQSLLNGRKLLFDYRLHRYTDYTDYRLYKCPGICCFLTLSIQYQLGKKASTIYQCADLVAIARPAYNSLSLSQVSNLHLHH